MATVLLACNLGSYGKFREAAWTHLPQIGVRHVEIGVPADDQVAAVKARLEAAGLTASTLQGPCDASTDVGVPAVERAARIAAQLGVGIMFVSVKEGEAPRAEVYRRLRAMGDAAGAHGVTLAVETHPEVAHNAEAALETMAGVDHPRVRLNFDTGNVYFYNHGVDAVDQVRRVAPYVAAVHLKDTDGGYRSWHFPALGQGVVDFAGVVGVLAERGFTGPYTMELEGVEGETLDEEGAKARVAASVAHLRAIGVWSPI
jgi:L-ribulose-5-phosphate 3-epimerase